MQNSLPSTAVIYGDAPPARHSICDEWSAVVAPWHPVQCFGTVAHLANDATVSADIKQLQTSHCKSDSIQIN